MMDAYHSELTSQHDELLSLVRTATREELEREWQEHLNKHRGSPSFRECDECVRLYRASRNAEKKESRRWTDLQRAWNRRDARQVGR